MAGTALLTDRYELTMLDAALGSGVASRPAVFETFARSLPPGRRYGVFAGLGRLLEAIEEFCFGPAEIDFLAREKVVSPECLAYLEAYRFSGTIEAYREGECFFPGSPVLTLEASFGEAVLLETIVLSVCNFDSAVAAAASRMVTASAGRPLIEMGARRTSELSAVAAARAAYLAGFASTSELEAGRRYGIPTAGTAAHAFILAHESERDAFEAQFEAMGTDTTLLVDTFDVDRAIRIGVGLARERGASGPGAIRLDSGHLATRATEARRLLDELGANETEIVITSDLDEYLIAELASEPIDSYGVGTRVVTGSGAPTAAFVYKLVAIGDDAGDLRGVEKLSPDKHSRGGRKKAFRLRDQDERARVELIAPEEDVLPGLPAGWSSRPLQETVMRGGVTVATTDLEAARRHHRQSLSELGREAAELAEGPPAVPTRFLEPDSAPLFP